MLFLCCSTDHSTVEWSGPSGAVPTFLYRDRQKRRGCLLSYSQAEPGRELTQPRKHLFAEPCMNTPCSPLENKVSFVFVSYRFCVSLSDPSYHPHFPLLSSHLSSTLSPSLPIERFVERMSILIPNKQCATAQQQGSRSNSCRSCVYLETFPLTG